MSKGCPYCNSKEADSNLDYKCPECGHAFWKSKKDYNDHTKAMPFHVENPKKHKEPVVESVVEPQIKRRGFFEEYGSALFWIIIIVGGVTWVIVSGTGADSSTTNSASSTIAVEDSCENCQKLEEAKDRISELEDCNERMSSSLENINSNASMNSWSDYNSMGDALDEIDSDSASYIFCN